MYLANPFETAGDRGKWILLLERHLGDTLPNKVISTLLYFTVDIMISKFNRHWSINRWLV